jgi:hypothetical protein
VTTTSTSPGTDRSVVDPHEAEDTSRSDNLELELRHLRGVDYVALTRQASVLLIELGTDGTVPAGEVAAEASRVAEGWLDGEVEIQIIDERAAPAMAPGGSSLRVQLLAAVGAPTGAGADERVEIHLAHQGRRSVGHASRGGLVQIAQAALAALRQLGFPVPYEAEAVHLLPDDLGAGVLVVLRDRLSGERRRGVAAGRSEGETVARAVLNGLNRYLQTVDRRTGDH